MKVKEVKEVRVIKLGTCCVDKATKLQGTVTPLGHYHEWKCELFLSAPSTG